MNADKSGEETRQGLQRVETKIDLLNEDIKSLSLQVMALEAALNTQPVDGRPAYDDGMSRKKMFAFLIAFFRGFRRRLDR